MGHNNTDVFKVCLLLLVFQLLMGSCIPQATTTEIPHEYYTQVVKTVAVQMTQSARLTPSITPTQTPEPTPTITSSPEPTPTVPSPTATWSYREAGTARIPILVYHDIADENNDSPGFSADSETSITPDVFHQQIETLYYTGYQAIPMTLLVNSIRYGAELPEFPIVITFDSTSTGIFSEAYPILKSFGYVGNVFVTVHQIDGEGRLSQGQIETLIEDGWRIGSHGMKGVDLTSNYPALSEEISTSKTVLEETFGIPITLFSYPFGRVDDMVSTRVSAWGYEAAFGFTWYQTSVHSVSTLYYLSRFEVKKETSLEEFFERLPWQPNTLPTTVPNNE